MTELISRIPDVFFRCLSIIGDERGSFCETYRYSWFSEQVAFVQGNASVSAPNVLRGMHYHLRQDDYWVLLQGNATVALADLRTAPHDPVRPQVEVHAMIVGHAVFIPRGVAHGFYAHDQVLLSYLVSNYYDGTDEHGVAWNDPDLAITWPCSDPILSPRDRENPRLRDIPGDRLPG